MGSNNQNLLSILSWNANGLSPKLDELADFASTNSPDIIAIQETRLPDKHRSLFIEGYFCYQTNRIINPRAGGTAIYVKHNIPHHKLPSINIPSIDTTVLQIKIPNNPTFTLISTYVNISCTSLANDLINIFQQYPSVILIGDFNAAHTSWNCRRNNQKGVTLFNLSTVSQFTILAPLQPTFYSHVGTPSIIDFAISNNINCSSNISTIHALSSDHFPIKLTLNLSCPKPALNPSLRTNWREFHDILAVTDIPSCDLTTESGIDEAVAKITEMICDAKNKATHIFETKPSPRLPHYIKIAIRYRNHLRRIWTITKSAYLKSKLNAETRKVRSLVHEYRNEHWRKLIADLNAQDVTLWKFTKKIKTSYTQIPPLQTRTGLIYDDQEKAEAFAAHFEKQFQLHGEFIDLNNPTDKDILETVEENMHIVPPIPIIPTDIAEVQDAIANLKPKKAPGRDGISNHAIQKLPPNFISFLTLIFNAAMNLCFFPTAWKQAVVILIPKPGENPSLPGSYRPISLLPCLGKLLEKILQQRLVSVTDELEIIPPHQFGFRPNLNTTLQLLRVVEFVSGALSRQASVGAVFFDVSKAFDRVFREGLIYKLIQSNFPTSYVKLIHSFLSNRTFCIKHKKLFSNLFSICAGVPQGSLLSPLLFNIYTSDLPTTPTTTTALFADDTAILACDKHIPQLVDFLQHHIVLIEDWCRRWKVKLNPQKTQAIIFSRCRSYVTPQPLFLFNQQLEYSSTVKYLGIILDKHLTWLAQTKNAISRFQGSKNKIASLLFSRHLSHSNKILLYKTILRPALLYACPVWGFAAKTHLDKVQCAESKTLRYMRKGPLRLRNTTIRRDYRINTIHEQIRKTASKFFTKVTAIENHALQNIEQYTVSATTNRKRPRAVLFDPP